MIDIFQTESDALFNAWADPDFPPKIMSYMMAMMEKKQKEKEAKL
jgi:hypothetical protein